MKKFIKTFILVICLMLPAMFCLTACDNHKHKYATEWSSDANYHYHKCIEDGCEAMQDKTIHTFGEWTTSTNATCTENGEKYRECLECGHREIQAISATGHTFGEFIIDETPTTQCAGEGHRECSVCHEISKTTISPLKSIGLSFALNEDEKSYTLTGIGTCADTYINIPNTHNSLPVTAIGSSAFSGNTNIKGINLSNNITSIGYSAFSNCENLEDLVITDGVTTLGEFAFAWCGNLKSVTIGNGLLTISRSAFQECFKLTEVTIGNNVTEIGNSAFFTCSGLETMVISENVTTIGDSAFADCGKLKNIIIPNSITSMGRIFNNNLSLSCIFYAGSKTQWNNINIESDTFPELTKVYYYSERIPQELGVKSWYYYNGEPRTRLIHFEHSYGDWKKDEINHWRVCPDCEYLDKNAHTFAETYSSNETDHWRVCPDCEYQEKNTHAFASTYSSNETNHWYECVCGARIEDVTHTFKNGVCEDCEYARIELAFNYLELSNSYEVAGIGRVSSREIVVPLTYDDGVHGTLAVTSIGDEAFKNSNIAIITLTENITNIGMYAFYGSSLIQIQSLLRVTTIGKWAFAQSRLESIELPSNITTIEEKAFYECNRLSMIIIPNGVETIKKDAFGGCQSMNSIIIPVSVNEIEEGAFANLTMLLVIGYEGSEAEFGNITINNQSGIDLNKMCYYSETQPTTEGKYWHYNDQGQRIYW